MFFQDPNKGKHPEPTSPPPYDDEWATGDIPIQIPYLAPEESHAEVLDEKWVQLTISSTELTTTVELVDFPIDIGSHASGIQLNDKAISPRHAVMDLHNGTLTITDTNSQTGVYIGDKIINPNVPYTLLPGATINLGLTKITVEDFAGNGNAGNRALPTDIFAKDLVETVDLGDFLDVAPDEMPIDDSIHDAPPDEEVKPTRSTLTKLLDEPDALLFRDVLGISEPEPEPEEEEEEVAVEEEPQEDIPHDLTADEYIELSQSTTPDDELSAEDFLESLLTQPQPVYTQCQNCDKSNLQTDKFCAKCGTAQIAPPAPADGTCTGCGKANTATAKFCAGCGNVL